MTKKIIVTIDGTDEKRIDSLTRMLVETIKDHALIQGPNDLRYPGIATSVHLGNYEIDIELPKVVTKEDDDCPECGAPLTSGDGMSGVKCTKCDYWFCY